MARQIIKLGELVKTAWAKVNANFQELYNAVAGIPTKTSQLQNDSGFLTADSTAITGKVDKVDGKGLSTEDYTTAEKNKLAGINLDLYAKKTDIASAYIYKGSKANYAALPTTGNAVGDVWNTEDTGMNYAWTGTAWDPLGSTIDLSGYATTAAMNAALNGKVDKVDGKGLSTNDYTTAEKQKLAGLSAPSKETFTVANWGTADASGYFTYTITSTRNPVKVMKKNGTTYEEVIIQANATGSAIVLISEEAFEGYVLTV